MDVGKIVTSSSSPDFGIQEGVAVSTYILVLASSDMQVDSMPIAYMYY